MVSTLGRVAFPKPALPNGVIKYVAHKLKTKLSSEHWKLI
jgi:hypothetical protein